MRKLFGIGRRIARIGSTEFLVKPPAKILRLGTLLDIGMTLPSENGCRLSAPFGYVDDDLELVAGGLELEVFALPFPRVVGLRHQRQLPVPCFQVEFPAAVAADIHTRHRVRLLYDALLKSQSHGDCLSFMGVNGS